MTQALQTTDYPTENSLDNINLLVLKEVEDVVYESMESILRKMGERDYSSNTAIAIWRDLKNFIAWYMEINNEAFRFERVTQRDIRDYRDQAMKKELSVATINRRLSTLNQFFSVAVEHQYIEKNPVSGVKQLAKQSLAPKSLSQSETRRLLKEVEIRGNLRDRCIVELMIGAGLRVSEVVGLRISDVSITERKGHVTVRNGKGNKTRIVPLAKGLRELLEQHIAESPKTTSKLFMGQRGALSSLAVNKIVEKYAEKAGVEASPHTLRHTFAYSFLKEHPSEIVALSQILGHSNINTTAIYTQNRLEDLQEKVETVSI